MGSLKAKQLLFKAAKYLDKERSKYSQQEIVKKINEIKYLSTQKKVPRLTLRKEIIHLENKLGFVLESEKEVLKHKKEESVKVKSLKKQVLSLKNKLTAYEDKNLDKKVNKLSHLLGEFLAKQGSKADVELSKKVLKELEIKDKGLKTKLRAIERKKEAEETPKHARYPVLRKKVAERTAPFNENEMVRVKELQKRLAVLKQELLEVEELSPEQVNLMKQKVNLIETKLKEYYEQHPELMSTEEKKSKVVKSPIRTGEIKHTLMFGSEKIETKEEKENSEVHEELPLPPPPRMTE